MLIAKMIQYVVFGPLRVSEKQVSLVFYAVQVVRVRVIRLFQKIVHAALCECRSMKKPHLISSMLIPQHLKDKFWNFIFYKFIFIFGVLNVQTVEEVVMWCLWFSALVFLHLMVQVCKDRFEYVSTVNNT